MGVPAPIAATLAAATNQFPLAGTNTGGSVTYFGVVGEGGLRVNWRATDHLRLTGGYSFLYWNNVRRAQEAFASSALLHPRAADFTTHLFSVGLDVRY
ncbi:MAG: BBP7 family outer membrane beta-barrel protein [Microbacterium sp.]|nr:BBP7 family outer membrane beta-barrel protein [Microbacterium sp.]